MTTMFTLTAALKAQAAALGFNRVGVIPATPARRLDAYLAWIAAGYHGEMGYLARPDRLARRRDLAVILPGARSLVVVGLDYATAPPPPDVVADPSRGRFSNYAWGVDYHDVMTPRLEALAGWLERRAGGQGGGGAGERGWPPRPWGEGRGEGAEPPRPSGEGRGEGAEPPRPLGEGWGEGLSVRSRVYVDTGALLERDHGETAGLGFTGKNTLLIDPRRGSWFFLGVLLTTVPLAYDAPLTGTLSPPLSQGAREPALSPTLSPGAKGPSCGRCHRCLDACPTAAFPAPYVLDARRCISYLTIELKGWIPAELRPLMGNWVYGCDVCQDVCPFNRFAAPASEAAFWPVSRDAVAPPLLDLLALDDAAFVQRFANSPVRRIGRARLVRNACVAAGNWGSAAAVPALVTLLADSAPLVRGHAAWALRRIGGPAAQAALATALMTETDPAVQRELLE
jgi:epoxyqueuosine reductase